MIVSRTALQRYERGLRIPSDILLFKICNVLCINDLEFLSDLLDNVEPHDSDCRSILELELNYLLESRKNNRSIYPLSI